MLPHPSTSKSSGRAFDFSVLWSSHPVLLTFNPATLLSIPPPFFTIRQRSGMVTTFQGPSLLIPFLPYQTLITQESKSSLEAGVLLKNPYVKLFRASSPQRWNQNSPSPARFACSNFTSAHCRYTVSTSLDH